MGMACSVLVVDDHAPTVQVIQSALEGMGLEVRTAANGAECLLVIDNGRPDLVILDVIMPVLDGFQTLQIMQQSSEMKDIPVIMLTARSSDEDIAHGWQFRVTSYLTKPFSIDNLTTLVRRVLEGSAQVAAEKVERT